jgi:hypothetical protein
MPGRNHTRQPELRPSYCFPRVASGFGEGSRRCAGSLELVKPYCRRGTRIWVCEHDHWMEDGAYACGPLAHSLATFCAIKEMKRRQKKKAACS